MAEPAADAVGGGQVARFGGSGSCRLTARDTASRVPLWLFGARGRAAKELAEVLSELFVLQAAAQSRLSSGETGGRRVMTHLVLGVYERDRLGLVGPSTGAEPDAG